MIQLPIIVQEAPIVRMTNSVLVGTMKFTLDQFDAQRAVLIIHYQLLLLSAKS